MKEGGEITDWIICVIEENSLIHKVGNVILGFQRKSVFLRPLWGFFNRLRAVKRVFA